MPELAIADLPGEDRHGPDPHAEAARAQRLTFTALVETHARLLLTIYTVGYGICVCLAAAHKAFWFDEITAKWISELPRLSDVWEVLRRGLEMNPPAFLWFMWLFRHVAGAGHIVTRLPAMFGFWLMTLCVYHFVRRRTRSAYAFIALVFPFFSVAAGYAIEARGYGLELGFSALALLCWQRATEGSPRRLALLGTALGAVGAVSCHYYATYLIFALLVGELVRAFAKHRVDWPCTLTIATGFLPLLLFSRLLVVIAGLANTVYSVVSVEALLWYYFEILRAILPLGLPLLVYIVAGKVQYQARTTTKRTVLPLWELTTVTLLAAMPLALQLAALWLHVGTFERYSLLAVPAMAILLVCALFRMVDGSTLVADFVLKTAFFFCTAPWLILRGAMLFHQPSPAELMRKESVLPPVASRKLVFTDELTFLQEYFYLPPNRANDICVLLDLDAATKYSGQDIGFRQLQEARRWWPVPVYNYKEFVARNPEFFVLRQEGPDWLLHKLMNDGAKIQLVEFRRDPGVFALTAEMYKVKF